jgi:DNA-binding NarL/FixJ family response regulator
MSRFGRLLSGATADRTRRTAGEYLPLGAGRPGASRSTIRPMGRMTGSAGGAILRVVIADDHRLLPEAVRALLEPDADIEVAGVTYEADRILPLVAEVQPDLLLLDSHMPGTGGLGLLDRLRASYPTVAVVLLAESRDEKLTAAAFERGAKGVIVKGSDPDALAPTLRAAFRGENPRPAPPAIRREAVPAMGTGLSTAEIARELSSSRKTLRLRLHLAYDNLAARLEAFRAQVDRMIFGNDYNWLD